MRDAGLTIRSLDGQQVEKLDMQTAQPFGRVIIITGAFGSGKSEYAINLALQSQVDQVSKKALVDLDLVNAFFRSRERRQLLASQGVTTIVPPDPISQSDLPIAGPGVGALIKDPHSLVIIDVGGDSMGATALGTYRKEIKAAAASIVMVVNPYRPFSNTPARVKEMRYSIESSSGINIQTLVSNPNTGVGSSLEQIIAKHQMVVNAAQEMHLPLLELLVARDLYQLNREQLDSMPIPVRPLDIYLSPAWLLKEGKRR